MDETIESGTESGAPFLSRTGLLWLTGILCVNLAIGGYVWSLPAESEEPVAAEQLPGLTLISELSSTERQTKEEALQAALANAEAARESARQQAGDPLVCRVWGPFNDEALVDRLTVQVARAGSALEIQESEIAAAPDYLVYVETENSRDRARRTLKELETQSIDAYVIAGGPYQNSVSVGVFSREDRAVRQKARIEKLGYQAVVQPLNRSQRVFHLVARVPHSFTSDLARGTDCAAIASAR